MVSILSKAWGLRGRCLLENRLFPNSLLDLVDFKFGFLVGQMQLLAIGRFFGSLSDVYVGSSAGFLSDSLRFLMDLMQVFSTFFLIQLNRPKLNGALQ